MGKSDEFLQRTEQPKFKLHLVSGAFVFIFILSRFLSAVRSDDWDLFSTKMGELVGGVIVALLLGWLAFLIMRRSNIFGNIVFCALIVVPILSSLGINASKRSSVGTAPVDQETKRIATEALKQIENGHAVTPNFQGDKQTIEELGAKAATLKGAPRAAVECMAVVLRERQEPQSAYQSAFEELGRAGGVSAEGLVDKSTIENRLAIVLKLNVANEAFAERISKSLEVFEACMVSHGIETGTVREAVHVYGQTAAIPELLALRETDRRICKSAKGILQLLNEHWGAWRWEPDRKQVKFESEAIGQEVALLALELQAAGRDQQAIQKEMFGRLADGTFP